MLITVLKSKIHRATVTGAELDYVGSVTVGEELLQASGIFEYEQVQVVNINTGARFETYAIKGERGEICLNGAAARLAHAGDKVIIMAYAQVTPEERCAPKIVFLDSENRITRTGNEERHGAYE